MKSDWEITLLKVKKSKTVKTKGRYIWESYTAIATGLIDNDEQYIRFNDDLWYKYDRHGKYLNSLTEGELQLVPGLKVSQIRKTHGNDIFFVGQAVVIKYSPTVVFHIESFSLHETFCAASVKNPTTQYEINIAYLLPLHTP